MKKMEGKKKGDLEKTEAGTKDPGAKQDDSQKGAPVGDAKATTSKENKVKLDAEFSEMLISVGTSRKASPDELAAISVVLDEFVGQNKR